MMNDAAEILVGGRTLMLTAADGDALKAALLRYLRQDPAAAGLEELAELLRDTEHATSFVDADRLLHVGPWLLDPGGGHPSLTVCAGSTGGARRYYVAQLAYVRDAWWVTTLTAKYVMGRQLTAT